MSIQIGELAKLTNVNIQTIRFYEREGVLPLPARNKNGYRNYQTEDVKRVVFIRQAQSLGFSLQEIQELLRLRVDSESNCNHVKQQTEEKLRLCEQKLKT